VFKKLPLSRYAGFFVVPLEKFNQIIFMEEFSLERLLKMVKNNFLFHF